MINDLLRRQDGVITMRQAGTVGLSEQAVRRRVRSGHWRRCSRGVYFADDRPFDDNARIRAAVWSYGEAAAASGLAAAWWHGLTKFAPTKVEVTVPRNSNGRARPGSRIRRRDLDEGDVILQRDLRLTALPLTVLEAAIKHGGQTLLDSALQRRVDLPPLWTAHLRNKGRHGSPRARRLLQAADEGARSAAERLMAQLLRTAGITHWRVTHPVAGNKIVFAFIEPRVAVEVDGFAFHSDAGDFQRDRLRQNAIALAGWQVLRFTWLDLTHYPERVIATIRRAISA